MKYHVLLLALVCTSLAWGAPPAALTDLKAAFAKAKAEHKMLFVLMGRKDCHNCEMLKGMIAREELALPAAQYLYASVNVDDEATDVLFESIFKVEGNQLPFVGIASAEGKQLAAHGGEGTLADFQKLLRSAEKRATRGDGSGFMGGIGRWLGIGGK